MTPAVAAEDVWKYYGDYPALREIKLAVEKLFNVKVKDVRTANYAGKKAVQMTKKGRHQGLKSDWKKAYVTLAEGQTIEAFDIA